MPASRNVLRPILSPILRSTFEVGRGGVASLVEQLASISSVSDSYVIRRTDGEIEVGNTQTDTHGAAFGLRVDDDGLMLIRGGFANVLEPAGVLVSAVNLTGSFVTSTTNPSGNYATGIGAYFDLPFDGTGLVFNHYADTRGGLWHFVIDGGAPIPVSVWSSVVGVTSTVVATGLADGPHTCRATYQGADPAHPPGTPVNGRGWLIMPAVTSPGIDTALALIDAPPTVKYSGVRPQLIAVSSIPDFALSVRPDSEPAMAGKWVPLHGGDVGATRNITRSIVIDGVDVGSDPAVVSDYSVAVDSVVVNQTYTAYCASDAAGDFPLWNGSLVHSYERGKMTVTHSLNFIRDTYCAAGYFGMLPSNSLYATALKFSNGVELPVAAVARTTDLASPATSAVYLNVAAGNASAASVSSLQDALGAAATAYVSGAIFQEERVDNIAKVYWRRFDAGTVIPAGANYTYRTHFFVTADNPSLGSL